MKVDCLSGNREMILRVLQRETGEMSVFRFCPDFAVAVGGYVLHRRGWIETDLPAPAAISVLASLGLCDGAFAPKIPDPGSFVYSLDPHSGTTLMNLISVLSARQQLLNRAIDARGAFYISPRLMRDLLDHPPAAVPDLLQALYGRDDEYAGVIFSIHSVILSGFRKGLPEEAHLHKQLADSIVKAALSHHWVKAFTPRVKNQKYAFRTWINSIGLTGAEYEELRRVMLARLPGRADRRSIPRGRSK